MFRLKSQSLPETESTKSEFKLVADGNLNELSPNRANMQRSNSALPQSSQEIRSAGKNADDKKTKSAGKRWKVLRLLTLVAKRNKGGKKRAEKSNKESEDTSYFSLQNEEFSSGVQSAVKEITVTKPAEDVDSEVKDGQMSCASEKRIIWDESTIFETPSRKISQSQYTVSNKAIAAAVGKWKESIRSKTPEMYESAQGIPRRKGVCEELEKTVVNDGTSLHELRKDLTVYLTLDELGML